MRSLANPSIQILNLALALATNFGLPLILGVAVFGEYIREVACTLFLAKLLETGFDLYVIETIAQRPGGVLQVLPSALAFKLAIGVPLLLAANLIFPVDHVVATTILGASMFFSSSAVSAAYALKSRRFILQTLLASVLILFLALVLIYRGGRSMSQIIWVFAAMNALIGLSALYFSKRSWFSEHGMDSKPLSTYLRYTMFSFPTIFIQTGIIAVATLFASGKQLGAFRIGIAIIQAATTLMPINPRRIYYHLADVSVSKSDRMQRIPVFLAMIFWLFSLAIVSPWLLDALRELIPSLHPYLSKLPGNREYWLLVGIGLGVFASLVVLEKALLASRGIQDAMRIAAWAAVPLVTGVLLAGFYGVRNLILIYVLSCAFYIWTVIIINKDFPRPTLLPLLALCIIDVSSVLWFVFTKDVSPLISIACLILLILTVGYTLLRDVSKDIISSITERAKT